MTVPFFCFSNACVKLSCHASVYKNERFLWSIQKWKLTQSYIYRLYFTSKIYKLLEFLRVFPQYDISILYNMCISRVFCYYNMIKAKEVSCLARLVWLFRVQCSRVIRFEYSCMSKHFCIKKYKTKKDSVEKTGIFVWVSSLHKL